MHWNVALDALPFWICKARIYVFWTADLMTGECKVDSSGCKELTVVYNLYETARTLKIYFVKVSDRGNKTIVQKKANVERILLASKKID